MQQNNPNFPEWHIGGVRRHILESIASTGIYAGKGSEDIRMGMLASGKTQQNMTSNLTIWGLEDQALRDELTHSNRLQMHSAAHSAKKA